MGAYRVGRVMGSMGIGSRYVVPEVPGYRRSRLALGSDSGSQMPDSGLRCQIRVSGPRCQIRVSGARFGQISRVQGPGTGITDRITGYPGPRTKERGFSPG